MSLFEITQLLPSMEQMVQEDDPVSKIVNFKNIIVILSIQGILEATKGVLGALKIRKHKAVEIIMPYAPMILGACAALIPGLLEAETLGLRIALGVALGAIGGQVWKVVKTKIDLLSDK